MPGKPLESRARQEGCPGPAPLHLAWLCEEAAMWGGRPRPGEKPQQGHRRMASLSPALKPCPRAMQGDSPPRGGGSAGAKGLQQPGQVSRAPVPTQPSRGGRRWAVAPPRPLRPAPTHALLTARSFITYALLRTRSTPTPGVPSAHPPWHQFRSPIQVTPGYLQVPRR